MFGFPPILAPASAMAAAIVGALAACAPAAEPAPPPSPQEAFWTALSSHCGTDRDGRAYAGELVSEDERDVDWQGRAMIAHWAECSDDRIAIAFHTEDPEREDGWDRSRTWLVTRSGEGEDMRLTLKHDHRHDDGEPDAVTFYGGTTQTAGEQGAQDFPVDEESITLFTREGLDASLTNVWRLEVDPAGSENPRFTYQLTRRNDETRLFRVSFDASQPVEPPPSAWGWE